MYKEKLNEIMYSVNNKAISTKILHNMDRIRNNNDEGQSRRFVWELIQNAKDVAQEDVPLKISMTLDRDSFVFAHNGKNFRLKNLLSLINQVSGKNEGDGTIGKYGTGFITTHLLSEQVKVRGILEDFGFEPKRFEVLLDRSGRTDEDIISAVKRAIDSVKSVDDNSTADYSREQLNTEFDYSLSGDFSRKVAETGINDANCNLFYCMAFVPEIHEITLIDNIRGTKTVYTRGTQTDDSPGIGRLIITENGTEHNIVVSSDGEVQVAAEIRDGCALPVSEKTSRLFYAFPLIDNVQFPFPAVVNSYFFKVNEPRSCITLTDNPNSSDSEINKSLMKQATVLYAKLLDYLNQNGIKTLYNIIRIPPIFKRSDISEDWIRENIFKAIAQAVSERKILPGKDGLFAANLVSPVFPKAEQEEITGELNNLLGKMKGYTTISKDISEWVETLSSLSSDKFAFISARDLLQRADKIGDMNGMTAFVGENAAEWLRLLFDCATKVSALKNEIYAGSYKIIPTQSGYLKPITEVFVEETEIDDYYKNICDIIDTYLSESYKLNLRQRLISKDYDISQIEGLLAYDTPKVGAHIRTGTRRDYTRQYSSAVTVVKRMGACCSDERAYNAYRCLISDMPERYVPKLKLHEDVWANSHTYLTTHFESRIVDIAKHSTGFSQLISLCGSEDNAIDAINCFHELWEKYCQPTNCSAPVLVEESDGSIALKNMMPRSLNFAINDGIDDRLREIYRRIVIDDAAIIDKRITVGSSMYIQKMDELRAASLIGNKVTAELKEGALFNKPKEFQASCSLLMRWINTNEEKAKRLFPAYASTEDRMQLMTPGQAAEMSEQLDKFNVIMENVGCKDINELEKMLKTIRQVNTENDEPTAEDYLKMFGNYGYDPALNNLTDILERIGEKGEELAVELLKKQYGDSAQVILCNTKSEKQQGYDIVVKTADETLFYEVKTRTETSMYRYELKFSPSQAILLSNANYRVLLIVLSRGWGLADSVEFKNIFEGFTGGSFRRRDGYRIIV